MRRAPTSADGTRTPADECCYGGGRRLALQSGGGQRGPCFPCLSQVVTTTTCGFLGSIWATCLHLSTGRTGAGVPRAPELQVTATWLYLRLQERKYSAGFTGSWNHRGSCKDRCSRGPGPQSGGYFGCSQDLPAAFPLYTNISTAPGELSTNWGNLQNLDHAPEQGMKLLLPWPSHQPHGWCHGSYGCLAAAAALVGAACLGKRELRAKGEEGEKGKPGLKIAIFEGNG